MEDRVHFGMLDANVANNNNNNKMPLEHPHHI